MPITDLLTLGCVITRRTESGTVDADGNDIPSETTVTTVCELQQGSGASDSRSEITVAGEIGRAAWQLFLPAGTDVALGDRVEIDGSVYEFDGPPWAVRNPRTGVASHVEATVVRTEGGTHGS